MNCKPTQTDIVEAIENRKAYHPVGSNTTVDQSIEYLDADQQNFDLVTGLVRMRNKDKKSESIQNAISEMSKFLLGAVQGKSIAEALNILDTIVQPTIKTNLDAESQSNLFDLLENEFRNAFEMQRLLNTKSGRSDVPTFKIDQTIIDPVDNVGYTVDFLAVLSDNTFIIRDFQSAPVNRNKLGPSGTLSPTVTLIGQKDQIKYISNISHKASILRKSYGFKGVFSSRVVPIKFVERKLGSDTIVQNVSGPGQDPLIKVIAPFAEKTGSVSFDDFIVKLEERIERLKSNKDVTKQVQTAEQVSKLEKIKQGLIVSRSLESIIEYGKYVSNLDLSTINTKVLGDIYNELLLFQTIGESLREYMSLLDLQASDTRSLRENIAIIESALPELLSQVKTEYFNNRIAQVITDESGQQVVDEFGNIIPFTPQGYFSTWFYQLSQFDNPVFQALRSKLDKANYEKTQKIQALTDEVIRVETEVLQALKKRGMSWSDFMKILLDKDDNLVKAYDAEWLALVGRNNGTDYPQWFDVAEYYDWTERQKVFENKLKDLYPQDLAEQERHLTLWKTKNSLELENGKPKHPFAWKRARENGKLTFKEEAIVYSEAFSPIKNVPEFLAYYRMFEKHNREFRKMLGVEYRQLPNNFLPNIRKSSSERIDEWGLFKGTQSSLNDFINDFAVREDDRADTNSYLKRDSIPRFFLNPFKDKSGNIIRGEKSYQLGRSLIIFAKMAYNYEEMSKIEAEVLGMREFLLEHGRELQQSNSGVKVNMLGNNITIGAENITSTFDKFVQMYLYGLSIEPVIGDKSGKTEKALMQMKNYFTLKKLGFNFVSAAGGFLAAKLQAVITGKTGIYYDEQQYNAALRASYKDRKTFLAMNAFFDPMGHRFNNVSLEKDPSVLGDPSQRGFINKYVNSRLLMKPYSLGDEYIEEVVTHALSQNYYVLDGKLRKVQFPEDKETYKGKFIADLFSFENGVAKLNLPEQQQKDIWIAFRRAVQVVQSGIKGTIPEEDRAAWQGQIAGVLLGNFKSWIPGVMTERFGKVKYDRRVDTVYMGRFTALMQEIGDQKLNDKNEALQLGVFVRDVVLPKLGELTLQVASFHTIGGYFKGYRMKDNGTARLMYERWLAQNPQHKGVVTYEMFREVQQKQLKAAIVEMRIILSFMLLSVLAMGDWDDDGEKDYKKYLLTRKLMSVILKTKQEISFFVNPTEFVNLTKNPIPMVGLLQDATKTINNTFDELYDVANGNVVIGEKTLVVGEKDPKDRKNIGSYSHSWIPGVGGLFQLFDVLSDDVQYINQQ